MKRIVSWMVMILLVCSMIIGCTKEPIVDDEVLQSEEMDNIVAETDNIQVDQEE